MIVLKVCLGILVVAIVGAIALYIAWRIKHLHDDDGIERWHDDDENSLGDIQSPVRRIKPSDYEAAPAFRPKPATYRTSSSPDSHPSTPPGINNYGTRSGGTRRHVTSSREVLAPTSGPAEYNGYRDVDWSDRDDARTTHSTSNRDGDSDGSFGNAANDGGQSNSDAGAGSGGDFGG